MTEREIAARIERALRGALLRLPARARANAALDRVALDIDADLATIGAAELERRVADALNRALARASGVAPWR